MDAVSLLDVVRPYFFVGMDLGPGVHDVLELLHVDEHDVAWDDDGVVIGGVARIDSTNPGSPVFSPFAGGAQPDPDAKAPVWDWHDVAVRFRLTVARQPAAALDAASLTDADLRTAIAALGAAAGPARSDAPGTQFRLDLMFELVTVTIPKLEGAKLQGHLLVPDPANPTVKLQLPRILLIITQDSASDTGFDVRLGSWGAETMDDADPAIASLLRMTPKYALVNDHVGFGFDKAVLDFSATKTPPDLLDRFGIGDDFKGVYLPEVRLFATTQKAAGTAISAAARECIIAFTNPDDVEIWGDFSLDLDFLGDRLDVGIRIYGTNGTSYEPTAVARADSDPPFLDRYQRTVPSTAGPETENYLVFVDVRSGAAPFAITAVSGLEHPDDLTDFPDDGFFDDAANSPQDVSVVQRFRLFSHDQRAVIRVTSRNPLQRKVIVLDVFPDRQAGSTATPPQPSEAKRARLETVTRATRGSVQIMEPQGDGPGIRLRIEPPDGLISIDGTVVASPDGVSEEVTVDPGADREVDISWSTSGDEVLGRVFAYFEFGRPFKTTATTSDVPPMSATPVTGSAVTPLDTSAFKRLFDERPAGATTVVRVDGYASSEAQEQHDYNVALSTRRVAQLAGHVETVLGLDPGDVQQHPWGEDDHPSSDPPDDPRLIADQVPGNVSAATASDRSGYKPERFRVAVASMLAPTGSTDGFAGRLKREEVDEEEPERLPDPPPPKGQQPAFLRALGGTVRIERDRLAALEFRMTVDFQTAHEEGLEKFRTDIEAMRPGLEDAEEGRLPDGNPNPEDGVVELRYTLTHDLATGGYSHTLVGRAAQADTDGLWSWGAIPAADTTGEPDSEPWRDVLGLYFTLAPLMSATVPDDPPGGDVVPLAVALATPLAVTILGWAHVLRITHYGIELQVRHDEDEVHAALLFDVESALWLNLKIGDFEVVTTRPDKPIKIRYKAVGFGIDAVDDQPVRFQPVFDSSRGYTIDLADSGSLRVLPSLGPTVGDIIQILGARIARTNPLNLEVDLGLGVDLGVFTVDAFGFRLPLDPPGPPTITAIGIGVDIPGAISGGGYLQILQDRFAGQIDLRLEGLGLRVAAGLAVRTVTEGDRSATGVLATLAVEFPGGIPLGGTGLAIFGFLGLFAMHHRRLEDATARIPALDWQVNVAQGDPTRLQAWGPALDQWAFGVGAVAGTIEGGTILNVKGMVVVELPGPRVLLFVKARILEERPPTEGVSGGNLFAVVDVSPQRVLIGIQVSYEVSGVLELRVPVEAGFFFDPPQFPPEHFFVDVGTIANPATAKVLELFDATAYLMVHGDGIPDFPLLDGGLQGFSLAVGFRVSLLWGNTDAGLYVRASAGFDAGMAFSPFRFAGRVFLDGKLRLFIVSLEVHARLDLDSDGVDTLIDGEVCGKVSFFFFSVKGCVDFTLGTLPGAPAPPSPIRDLTLQSRSPALLEGTAVDRGVDTVLCRGTSDGSVPVVDDGQGGARQVFVPIDAIPLLQLEVAPVMGAGAVDGVLSGGLPVGAGDGWQVRGPNFLRYRVSQVALELVRLNGAPPPAGMTATTDGPRPYTWRHGAALGGEGLPVDLAMLDWKPTNADKAMVEGPALDAVVDGVWGHVCDPVAQPAAVLWTFRASPLGPSESGWTLHGEAWPDPPGAQRSRPVGTDLAVRETWRTGTPLDGLLPHAPAQVLGVGARCPKGLLPDLGGRPVLGEISHDLVLRADRAPAPSIRPDVLDGFPTAGRPGVGGPLPPGATADPGPRPGASNPRLCVAKVLEAPFEQVADALDADLLPASIVEVLRAVDKDRHAELRDVVRVSGGPLVAVTLLIHAHRKVVAEGMMRVRAVAPGGAAIAGVSATFTPVGDDADLPGTWRDPAGPWWDDVALARSYAEAAGLQRMGEYLVTVDLPEPALHVDLGVSPLATALDSIGLTPPSWLLTVVEALSLDEVQRAGEDTTSSSDDAGGVDGAVSGQGHALLRPGAEYRVVVAYDAEVGAKRAHPEEDEDPEEIVVLRSVTGQAEARTFFTDSQAPRNLDPWALAQFPGDGERFHFTDDPVVVVFATDDVLELFAAYQRTLRAVARAASFRGSAPDDPGTHVGLDGVFERLGKVVLSPWEATVRRRLGALPCLDADPDSDGHGRVVLPLELDPLTDYVLDLEALLADGSRAPVPALPGEVGSRPLYRRAFTTSRYASREELAEAVRLSSIKARLLPDPAPLEALADVVTDEVMDAALLAAGLEAAPPPPRPAVWKLWSAASPAVAVAILLHTPEPLWRSRTEPVAERDASGEHILRWRLQPVEWLAVDELVPDGVTPASQGGTFVASRSGVMTALAPTAHELRGQWLTPPPFHPPVPPPPAALVTRLVHDTGGTRTLAFLAPAAHGRTVTLGLRRTLHPLLDSDVSDTPLVLAEVGLPAPPWESP